MDEDLKLGANPNSLTPDGDNALHLACAFFHNNLIPTLLKAGVNPNTQNNEGQTPAHEAITAINAIGLLALFESSQLDLTLLNKDGLTPQALAEKIEEKLSQKALGISQ